ncbi:MAG: dTMP kinase [Firmicutes bacterium]|nr:dTMP kinase [Bacillota bacterium]
MYDGVFITFEGIEGAGKSTQAKILFQTLSEEGLPCLLTNEPGGTPIGNAIREMLGNTGFKDMAPLTELFLFSASRAQHVESIIRPSLEEGKIVICDRFADASIAYQGFGRKLPLTLVQDTNEKASWNVKPDITFFLDVEPAKGLTRIQNRIIELEVPADRIEKENLEFFERVREGYLYLSREEPHRYRVLDGSLGVDDLKKIILESVNKELTKRKFRKNLLFG